MNLQFPAKLSYLLEGGKRCSIICGTFSQPSLKQLKRYPAVPDNPEMVNRYSILFRTYDNGSVGGEETYHTGSMDPRQVASGNQLALIAVDLPNGQRHIIALWAPDGGEGRYMIDRDPYFYKSWMETKEGKKIGFLNCLMLALFLPVGFVLCTFLGICGAPVAVVLAMMGLGGLKNRAQARGMVGKDEGFTELGRWMQSMMEKGTLQTAYLRSMGISMGESGRL